MKLAELKGKLTFLASKKPKDCSIFIKLVYDTLEDFINNNCFISCKRLHQSLCEKAEALHCKSHQLEKVFRDSFLNADHKFHSIMVDNVLGDIIEIVDYLKSS